MAASPLLQVQNLPASGRVMRRPKHSFQLRSRPWQIVPFMCAPVLPGETMKNFLHQARVVTDPVKHPLVGWWAEYYWFYVKHRDLAGSDDFQAMVLEYGHDMSAYLRASSHDTDYYNFLGGVEWTKFCVQAVVNEYFRREGEVYSDHMLGNYYCASHNLDTALDSLANDADFDTSGSAHDGTETLEELDRMQQQWEFMRAYKLTEMSYEDFLKTYGVRVSKADINKPELLRYVRDWTYPTNTIDPSDGSPTSACSWAIQERGDKDRFFREPGFILGVSVIRPKVYFSSQKGGIHGLLSDALSWLPAIMRENPETSLRRVAATGGPLPGLTDDYWLDLRDLFVYGDQFVNFALSETNAALVALPEAGGNWRYPTSAMADALFVSASPANQIRQDGICQLTIAGTQVDMT